MEMVLCRPFSQLSFGKNVSEKEGEVIWVFESCSIFYSGASVISYTETPFADRKESYTKKMSLLLKYWSLRLFSR